MLLAFEREAVKKREAGLVNDDEGDDDENDDQKSSRSGEGKKKRVKRKTTEKARDDSTDEGDFMKFYNSLGFSGSPVPTLVTRIGL